MDKSARMLKLARACALALTLVVAPNALAYNLRVGGWAWPAADGPANSCLATDGGGNLSFLDTRTLLSGVSPLHYSSGVFTIQQSSGTQPGYLSSTDWSTFNSKQNALMFGSLTSPTSGVTVTGGTGAVIGSGAALSIQNATGAQPGLLTSADWTTFNGKQNALSFGNFTTPGLLFSVSGGTGAVIGSGLSLSLVSQAANSVLAGPSSGSAAAPAFRSLVPADIPATVLGSTANGGVTGTLGFGNGGTSATTQQAAIDALSGTQSAGKYLRSDGTHATLSSIQAADVPTLNQSTTGTAANVTGVVAPANGGTGQNMSASSGIVKVASGTFSAAAVVDADVSSSAAIAPSKLGQASAITNQALVWNGSAWAPGSVGGGALTVTGSTASPTSITAAGGVAFSGGQSRALWFVQGSGGAVAVTASPQIAAGSTVGQELLLTGTSDTNTVTLADGNGLSLNGTITLYKNTMLYLIWDGSLWVENDRRS